MPEYTAARADRFSATLARTALTLAALLAALGMAAWILRAPLPAWVWVCVWSDALILTPLLFLRTLTPRVDPRLAGTR
jgi:uncharacterized protein (DUF983 family)